MPHKRRLLNLRGHEAGLVGGDDGQLRWQAAVISAALPVTAAKTATAVNRENRGGEHPPHVGLDRRLSDAELASDLGV